MSGGGFKLNWIPAGHAEYTSLGTAIGLSTTAPTEGNKSNACTNATVPVVGAAFTVAAMHAVITVEVQPVRATFDGTTPTSSTGLLLPVGTVLTLGNSLDMINAAKFIETTGGAAISVAYFV